MSFWAGIWYTISFTIRLKLLQIFHYTFLHHHPFPTYEYMWISINQSYTGIRHVTYPKHSVADDATFLRCFPEFLQDKWRELDRDDILLRGQAHTLPELAVGMPGFPRKVDCTLIAGTNTCSPFMALLICILYFTIWCNNIVQWNLWNSCTFAACG